MRPAVRPLTTPSAASTTCPVCGSDGQRERDYVPAAEGHSTFEGRSVARCRSCSLRYCDPMPTGEELDAYYTSGSYDSGDRRDPAQSNPWSVIIRRSRAQVDLAESVLGRPPASWLDLGAAFGALLDEARRRGASTAGVESTPLRLEGMRERGHRAWAVDDEVEGTFEVVSFSHVLEHVADPLTFLARAAARLTPGGVLLCEVPNVLPDRPRRDEPHVLFFTEPTLARTFEAAGLDLCRIAEAGWRQGPTFDKVHRVAQRLEGTGRLPTALLRFDTVGHYGSGQRRSWLRCVATPASD